MQRPSARAPLRLTRPGAAAPTGGAGAGASAATTPFSVPVMARPGGGGAMGSATRRRQPPPPSKLRAGRQRRQRERSMDDADELDHKFSALSVAAPEFVPASQRSTPPAASTTAAGGERPKRSMAFVTERNPSKRVPPPRQPATRTRTVTATASVAGASAAKPRRQRIGEQGFSKSKTAAASTPQSLRRQKQQKDKLTLTPTVQRDESGPVGRAKQAEVPPQRRPRSDSAGSDSDDEVYPDEAVGAPASAFSATLSLFSQQKHIPMRASRDEVIDTIFDALFTRKKDSQSGGARFSAFGDDTGTETDEPNEEFVKRGLAASLFKDHLSGTPLAVESDETPQQAIDRFLTPKFIHGLVTDMRFEDFRTASARLDIVRAIHKSCPTKRLDIARALADATLLRVDYVRAITAKAHALSVEKSRAIVNHQHDHGHGFTELLRYAIEHVNETVNGFGDAAQVTEAERSELLRNYMASLIALWRAHWLDPAGSDDEELITSAGQFVAYLPSVTHELLSRLLRAWPSTFPSQEVIAIRMIARVIMSGPPLYKVDPSRKLQQRVFARLARSIQSPHVEVAKEALAFTGCQFVMMHFLDQDPVVYKVVTGAFHANAVAHWNEVIRKTSDEHFDRALDFA